MIRATSRHSSLPEAARLVIAGVPMRMPLATIGFCRSKGIAFLLTVMPISSRYASTAFPVRPLTETSTSSRWVSVPPPTRRRPAAHELLGHGARVVDDLLLIALETRAAALRRRRRPWRRWCASAGRLEYRGRRSCRSAAPTSCVQRMMPPRGPRSVLCVVDVTKSATATGDGCKSDRDQAGDVRHVDQQRRADLVGDLAERSVFHHARIRAGAGDDHLGPVLARQARALRRSRSARFRAVTPYATAL